MLHRSAEYDRLQRIFFIKLTGFWQPFLEWTDCVHVHLQVNGQRADTRKILSGSCIFSSHCGHFCRQHKICIWQDLWTISPTTSRVKISLSSPILYGSRSFVWYFVRKLFTFLTFSMPFTQVLLFLLLAPLHIIDARTFARRAWYKKS